MARIRDFHTIDNDSFSYVYEENVSIPLTGISGLVRCNTYRPKNPSKTYPALVTYGPYGKDVHYGVFYPDSFKEVPEEHHSAHSAWETPDPRFWTGNGYAIVRADEIGTGQSPGLLDTMSENTSRAFARVIEWVAVQPWCSGKVGFLGIIYYAGTQWRVAARQPKGLACMIPWEGMSDYYRDRCRHCGILSNTFIRYWWDRQYGLPGRAARGWGKDTVDGDLDSDNLARNRRDQNEDNLANPYMDSKYHSSRSYSLSDIKIPLLSVANWGGILLHLRGNVEGYLGAGSELKFLRFITGRHDLPFYLKENVEMQKSFLDAFLIDEDKWGWKSGKMAKVSLVLRQGDVGHNDPEAERAYPRRDEEAWPIARAVHTKYYLTPDQSLTTVKPVQLNETTLSYLAPSNLSKPELLQFTTPPFSEQVEFTGDFVAHINVSLSAIPNSNGAPSPSEIDLFVTIRHLNEHGKEILYTGTTGDPVPVTKGWLRVSLRKLADSPASKDHKAPHRLYRSVGVQPVIPGETYSVTVELWPTTIVVDKGHRLVLEVASGDTQGAGLFEHNSERDRPVEKLRGFNHIRFGPALENWLSMPVILAASNL